MQEDGKFKFDVAFSFLQEDEHLAYEINDLVQDRFNTFIYSEHQADIAGRDGEKKFNEVFGKEARLVVVLFRDKWGSTSWTRIEDTAIRNRSLTEGYDFTLFVKLDQNSEMPRWIPKVRIYADYGRWGSKGVAAIIESRIQELGGNGSPETIDDLAARMKRQVQLEQKRQYYFGTLDAFNDAKSEFQILYDLVTSRSESLRDSSINFDISIDKRPGWRLILFSIPYSLYFEWECPIIKSLMDSKLTIALCHLDYDKHISLIVGRRYSLALHSIAILRREYQFDFNPISSEKGWKLKTGNSEFIYTQKLVDDWLYQFIDIIRKQKISHLRK